MKWNVLNIKGDKVGSVDLPASIFAVEMNEGVLHSVVKSYRANRRQGTHATKTRSFVSGGGKKPFKQKGTGGARQGSSRSPLMPGGGTSHGPQPRDYREDINRKVRQQAVRIALSDRVRHNQLVLVDDFCAEAYSTKKVCKSLEAIKSGTNALLVDARTDDFLYRSARNIYGIDVAWPTNINAENILAHKAVVMTKSALEVLTKRLGEDADESV
jgi:large subunit ribosomal protein L4